MSSPSGAVSTLIGLFSFAGPALFNGGGTGYDGVTTRNPRDNNTMFFNLWVVF